MYGPRVGVFPLTITVASGTGNGTFTATGKIWDVYISPNQTSTYDWNIKDGNNVPRGGATQCSTATVYDLGGRTIQGTSTITILNATNGTYAINVNVEIGH